MALLLALGPASVYALRQRIASSVGFFWQESFGQLFPTLAELEKEGLVSGRHVADGRRRRRDYAITGEGEAALAAWLEEPPAPQAERNELLLKVFLADPRHPGALAAFIAISEVDARAHVRLPQDRGLPARGVRDRSTPALLVADRPLRHPWQRGADSVVH